MVGVNVNGPTRDQVLKFMEEKDRIEREIQELTLVLQTNGDVGMHEPLVDLEGFPRSDIDVYRVRHARHRILCLQNDHKEIMKQIERGLAAVHQELRGQGEGTSRANAEPMDTSTSHMNGHIPNGNGHTNGHMSNGIHVDHVVEGTRDLRVGDQAFAEINLVSPGSPAELAGLQPGDELVQFGSINASNFRELSQITAVVSHSAGSRVDVRVRRSGAVLSLSLMPARWEGRGMLGCNVIAL